jgi:hypothetical protein
MIGHLKSGISGITLLLTATIHPRSTIFVRRSDPMIRLTDYRIALSRWLSEPAISRIVFCENSGADLDQLRFDAAQQNIHNQEIIFISYTAPEPDGARGKSYGELGILSHVLSRLVLGDSARILKVTGRYAVDNFESILVDIRRHGNADIITTPGSLQGWVPSECFYATTAFLCRYLLRKRELINEAKGFYFELALAQAIAEAIRDGAIHAEFTDPHIIGVSGTMNLPRIARRSPAGIELALTPDYRFFFRATIDEFCQQMESNPERVRHRDALKLVAKFVTYNSAISPLVLTNVMFTYDDLRILQASIEGCLCEPANFAERTGFSVEDATAVSRAIERVLEEARQSNSVDNQ